jgi:cell fate regulator YaaT (PSP1 superfamily)
MPTVIPVKFKYAARDLWFNPRETGAQEGDHVICSTERGAEIGLATMDAREVSSNELRDMIGESKLQPVVRICTESDLDRAEELAQRGEDALPVFRRLVHESGLDMKPVGVEYLFGGEKVVCYFSAEERVDFRQLVRDLSHELHERIDMRQIGVREEAAIVGGFGHCGQELCCARFGHQFEPVSIRMAKEQDLPLNSNKISGACGRLMCCLRYEFEAYRDFKQRAPKRNAVIDTPLGKAKIVEYDTPKEQLCLRIENGKTVRIPLADMTTSEAAVKKSEELHCPCRPDTVTRDALDRLQSPDVQMALAELDRKNGVTPAESFEAEDIFVETRRKRRRRGGEGQDASGQRQRPEGSTRRRGGQSEPGEAEAKGGTRQGGEPSARRRRKKVSASTPATEGVPEATHRRRRHHSASGEVAPAQGGDARSQQPQQRKEGRDGSQKPKGMQPSRRRRHPGDRGGQQTQQGSASGQQQRQGRQKPAQGGGKPQPTGEAGDAQQRRRRRHRGGHGHGKGGDAPSAGGDGSAS